MLLYYTDFIPKPGEKDSGTQAPVLRNRLLGILHGFMKLNPEKIAISIEKEHFQIRCFAQTSEDLMLLVESTKGHFVVRDYFVVTFPSVVNTEQHRGRWFQYIRHRIPSKVYEGEGPNWKQIALDKAKDAGWPFVNLDSKSNGHRYRFSVKKLEGQGFAGFAPNKFGLSTFGEPFFLPEI